MTECRARDRQSCRYHGVDNQSYQTQIETTYRNIVVDLERSSDVEEKFLLERELQNIEVEYAATDAGREELTESLNRETDPMEQERIRRVLEEGSRFRDRIEGKEDGVVVFPASKMEEADRRIQKANRKLERAGVSERFTYEVEEYVETNEDGSSYLMVRLTLNRPVLKVNGWSFAASLDQAANGELVTRVMPGQDLGGYRPEEFICDHCGSRRRRNSTYLVRNEEGEYKQVGSNCLRSFLGTTPQLWALQYDLENNNSYIDRGERTWGSADSMLPTRNVVAAALAISNEGENYVSSSRARDREIDSTSSQVRNYFFSRNREPYRQLDVASFSDKADHVISTTDFSGSEDYATNMRILLAQDYVAPRHLGYVTSVVSAYRRAQQEQTEPAPRAVGYLGAVNEKIQQVPVTVKHVSHHVRTFNGRDTDLTLLVFNDDSGREIKWNASGYKEYKKGDLVTITSATIKDLGEFNGNQQTVITRARILEG